MSLSEQPSGPRQRELFLKALEKPTPAERAAFLDGACGDDVALRAAVGALLADHREDSFLERPAVEPATVRIAQPNDEQVGTLIGRYKLLEALGEGGFGSVWLAEQKEPVRRKVALKVIKLGMDTKQVVARFEAERLAMNAARVTVPVGGDAKFFERLLENPCLAGGNAQRARCGWRRHREDWCSAAFHREQGGRGRATRRAGRENPRYRALQARRPWR